MNLATMTNRLQNLCHDGLANAKILIEGKPDFKIEYDSETRTVTLVGIETDNRVNG